MKACDPTRAMKRVSKAVELSCHKLHWIVRAFLVHYTVTALLASDRFSGLNLIVQSALSTQVDDIGSRTSGVRKGSTT